MKCKSFISITLILFLSFLFINCDNIKGPAIKFSNQLFDFGEIDQGVRVEHIFEFSNPGTDVLRIEKVTPTCGCTIPGDYTKEIPPKQKGSIPMIFNSKGFQGDVTKIIKVITNIPESEPITLTIKGKILVAIQVEPPNVWFGQTIKEGPPLTGMITLTNHTETPLEILGTTVTGPRTDVKVNTIEEGQVYTIVLSEPPPFKIEQVREMLKVSTNIEEKKTIEIPYSYYGTPDIELSPKEIIFIQDNVKEGFMRILSVISHTETEIALTNPTLDAKNISYTIEEFNPGKGYQVKFTFDPAFVFPEEGRYSFSFQLKTDTETFSYSVPFINAEELHGKSN